MELFQDEFALHECKKLEQDNTQLYECIWNNTFEDTWDFYGYFLQKC